MKFRILIFLFICAAYAMEQERKSIESYEELLRHLATKRNDNAVELDVDPVVFEEVPSAYFQKICNSSQIEALSRAKLHNPNRYKQTVQALLACTRTWHPPRAQDSSSNDLGVSEDVSLPSSITFADSSESILSELKEIEEEQIEIIPAEPLAQTELMLLANLLEVLREKIGNDAKSSEQQMKFAQEQLEFAKKVHKDGKVWKGIGICLSVSGAVISFLWSVGNGVWSGLNEANMRDC